MPSWEAMGLPGSLLHGNTETLPSSLNVQGAPKQSKSPRSWTRKTIKVQSSLAQQFAWCRPSMAAPAPCVLEAWFGHADLFPCLTLQGNPAPLRQGRVPKQAGPLRPQHTLLAQQQLSKRHGGSASHQQGCKEPLINPDPGSWLYHSPVLKVAPDGKKGKSTSAPQRLLYFPSLQIGSLLTL